VHPALLLMILLYSCGSCSDSVEPALLLWILLSSCGSCFVPLDPPLFLWILFWFCETRSAPVNRAFILWLLDLTLSLWPCSDPMAFWSLPVDPTLRNPCTFSCFCVCDIRS
jgi:hypothetical protein